MATQGVQRKLAAILAADVVGYSRLMAEDEEGTLAALKRHREELIDPSIAAHNGRIVKTTGDGMLAEFASVVDAVRNAAQVQRGMAERNSSVPEDRRITFRTGINLGDVIADDDDIYGDGVNVAARLQELCDPGGVLISGTAFDQVRDKLDVGYEHLGEQEVKNIPRPVRVYRVLLEPETAGTVIGEAAARRRLWQQPVLALLGVLLLVIGGVAIWSVYRQPVVEPARLERLAYPLPDKPSIAVLPFDNLSGDPTQDYLGDGLTENIIAVLSTSPDIFVIARNSSFTYKGKAVRVQEVAERFGVRYVLEGSVQREGERLRVTAQLVDAIDGRHVWAERYDRDLHSLFELQDDITQKILEEMEVHLTLGEQARLWRELATDPESYRLTIQGRERWLTMSPEGHEDAEKLWTEVYKRQPDGSTANNLMGWLYWQRVVLGLTKDPRKDLAVAREFGEKSLSIVEEGNTLSLLATLDLYDRNHESAIAHADRAIELDPTSGDAVAIAGWVKLSSGQPQEAVGLLKRAMRLEPYHPEWMPAQLALSHLMLGRYDEAEAIYEALIASPSDDVTVHPIALRGLAAISLFEGDRESARRHIEKLLAIQPKASASSIRRALYFLKDQAFLDRYLDGLRKAGLPE